MFTKKYFFLLSRGILLCITTIAFLLMPNRLFLSVGNKMVYAQSSSGMAVDTNLNTRSYDSVVSVKDIESSKNAVIGDYVDVGIVAQGVANLKGYVGKLLFDANKLQFVSGEIDDISEGNDNFLAKNGAVVVKMPVVEHVSGEIIFGAAIKGQDSLQAPDGSGLVAFVKFKVIGRGDATLALHNVIFTDSALVEYQITALSNAVLHITGDVSSSATATFTATAVYPSLLPDYLPSTGIEVPILFFSFLLISLSILTAFFTYYKQFKKDNLFQEDFQRYGLTPKKSNLKEIIKVASLILVVGLIFLNMQSFSQNKSLIASEATATPTVSITETSTVTNTATESPTYSPTLAITETNSTPASTFSDSSTVIAQTQTVTFTPTLTPIPNTGRLKGKVTSYATPIAGAMVSILKSPDWQIVATAITTADGQYVFNNLVPTNYRVKFNLTGYNVETIYFRNKLSLEQAAIISIFSGSDNVDINLELSEIIGTPTPTNTPASAIVTTTATPNTTQILITTTLTPQTTLNCDFDRDGKVYFYDLLRFADYYLTQFGDDNWNPEYDFNIDKKVDALDLKIFQGQWLKGV